MLTVISPDVARRRLEAAQAAELGQEKLRVAIAAFLVRIPVATQAHLLSINRPAATSYAYRNFC